MARWIVCYETAIKVSVEANTKDEAVTAAEITLGAVGVVRMRLHEITHCSNVEIDEIRYDIGACD